VRTLILYSNYVGTWRASYYNDWLEAFQRCQNFEVTSRNIVPPYLKVANPSKYDEPAGVRLKRRLTPYQFLYQTYSRFYVPLLNYLIKSQAMWDFSEIANYDLIVLLHSTNADSVLPLSLLESYFQNRKGKLLVFVGNEYCLMPEKINFIKKVEADYIASQLPKEAATWLYAGCNKSKILLVPHGLNSSAYKLYRDHEQRKKDIGFIGDRYSLAIGDMERTGLIEYFAKNEFRHKLNIDIRLGKKLRLSREKYVNFLNSIRGTIGAESGTYYLEKTDETQKKVEAYLSRHPQATFEEVNDRFFKNYSNPVNGKAVSSRHFEPIGTKTCQILLEGKYNDILKPDVHYISLNKDYSNIQSVMGKFADKDFTRKLTSNAHEYAMDSHTYDHRILDVWKEIS
jgi:hypothetical protein